MTDACAHLCRLCDWLQLGARAPGREDATTEAAVPPAAPGGEKVR